MAGVDSAREVVEQRLDDLQAQVDRRIQTEQRELRAEITHVRDYVDTRFAALQLAVDKAEDGINRRLDLLNEFRAQSADEAKKFSLREVTDQQLGDISARVGRLEQARSEHVGSGLTMGRVAAVTAAVVTVVVGVAAILVGAFT